MLTVNDLDRLEHLLDALIAMHEIFGISMEEAAVLFDRYARNHLRFVKSEMFFHATAEELAMLVFTGKRDGKLNGEACFLL